MEFKQEIILKDETSVELMDRINRFCDRMDKHIENYPLYDYSVEIIKAEKKYSEAKVTIMKYGREDEIKRAERDISSYGVL